MCSKNFHIRPHGAADWLFCSMALMVYRAAAGSGKTFTLVREYLRLALGAREVNGFRRILAITFTNKAAGEMKSRVLKALAAMAGKSDDRRFDGMAAQLREALGLDEVALQNRADQVLSAMLHQYQQLSIGTIDSFVARLARQFARELLLDQQFDILLDQDLLLNETVDRLLAKLGSDGQLTALLSALAREQMQEDKSWQVSRELKNFARQLLRDEMRLLLPRLRASEKNDFLEERKQLLGRIKALQSSYAQPAQQLLHALAAAGIGKKDLANGGSGTFSVWQSWSKGLAVAGGANLNKAIENEKWSSGAASPAAKAWLAAEAGRLSAQSRQMQEMAKQLAPELTLLEAIVTKQYAMATLGRLQHEMEQWMEENATVPLSSLYFRLADLLADTATPFIYERLGNQYRHFLIDEFQDTSVLQWNNLLPLVENGLAGGNDSLLVGDAKQSIYRWRSGEAEQFVQLPHRIDGSEGSFLLEEAFEARQLNTNFRSYRTVIDFNNRYFRWWADKGHERLQRFYEGLEQLGGKPGGLVQVELLDTSAASNKEERLQTRLERITHLLRELAAAGVPWGEIAILVRANDLGTSIAQHLLSEGIPVISGESLVLCNQNHIRLVMGVLHYLTYPNDGVNEQLCLQCLIQAGKGQALLGESLVDYIERTTGKAWPKNWAQLPIAEVPEQVLHFFGMLDTSDPYLLRLLDLLAEKKTRYPQTERLLEWWYDKGQEAALPMPEIGNAVRIMTYHKSKGLEFGVVIIADADRSKNGLGQPESWIDTPLLASGLALVSTSKLKEAPAPYKALAEREEEMTEIDYLNNLYVAFTRAVGALYILGTQKKPGSESYDFSHTFGRFLTSIGEENAAIWRQGELPAFEKAAPDDRLQLHTHRWHDWRERMALQHRFTSADANSDALALGEAAHRILADLPHAAALESVVQAHLAQGMVSSEQLDGLLPALRKLLADEKLKRYFEPGLQLQSEVSILAADGSLHRPDRLVYLPEEVVVLEFKTGAPLPKHAQQLDTYVGLLTEMGLKARGELVYLSIDHSKNG